MPANWPVRDGQTAFHPDGTPLSGPEVLERIRRESDTVIVNFSRGKDSIAAWLAAREVFDNIVAVYLDVVPGLRFVDASLARYEAWFGQHIYRIPHPSFYRWIANGVFQPVSRFDLIEAARIRIYDYDDVSQALIDDLDLPPQTFTISGVRAADSPNRRSAVSKHGAINWRRHTAWPIWDLTAADLRRMFDAVGMFLPVDYVWFGRTFDGLDHRFIAPLKEHAPDDYETVKFWFPGIEWELFRYEIA